MVYGEGMPGEVLGERNGVPRGKDLGTQEKAPRRMFEGIKVFSPAFWFDAPKVAVAGGARRSSRFPEHSAEIAAIAMSTSAHVEKMYDNRFRTTFFANDGVEDQIKFKTPQQAGASEVVLICPVGMPAHMNPERRIFDSEHVPGHMKGRGVKALRKERDWVHPLDDLGIGEQIDLAQKVSPELDPVTGQPKVRIYTRDQINKFPEDLWGGRPYYYPLSRR